MSKLDIEGILGDQLRVAREVYENSKTSNEAADYRAALNAYGLALRRFNAFISEGIIPPELGEIRKRDPQSATDIRSAEKKDEPAA